MIGKRIREARQARGMTQAALAKGIASRTYISAIEIGRIKPSAENLKAIAERLEEHLDYFLPGRLEETLHRFETNLNQAKALLATGELVAASPPHCHGVRRESRCTSSKVAAATIAHLQLI